MTSAAERLSSMIADRGRHDVPLATLLPTQLEAANERLRQHGATIDLVRNRIEATGVNAIRDAEDLVPLLFAHTAYKSYPESWLSHGRWDLLCEWLDTVAAVRVQEIDVGGVKDIDDWLQRLAAKQHFVSCSSGSSGKVSMIYSTMADRMASKRNMIACFEWSTTLVAERDREVFICNPPSNNFRFLDSWAALTDAFATSVAHQFAMEPVTVGRVREMVTLRADIAKGTARPADIAAFEALTGQRRQDLEAAVQQVAAALISNHESKLLLVGMYPIIFQIAEAVRDQGLDRGDFQPQNAMMIAGGLKGATLPTDYHERILSTFNIDPRHVFSMYGMQELNTFMPRCTERRYHIPPWLMLLPLDEKGEKLAAPLCGEFQGRAAFFDLSHSGRWGGVVSGDRIDISYGRCICGHEGPTIGPDITRYSDLPGGDKISCAGTIDAYVRGTA